MSSTFNVDCILCYGKGNPAIDELETEARKRVVFDPTNEAWYIGEWDDE